VLSNALGYRIHDSVGELICADASPKGLSPPALSGCRHAARCAAFVATCSALATGRPLVNLVLEGVQIVGMKLAFDASGRYLLMSATHIMGHRVTHLIYDGCRGVVVGGLTAAEGSFARHARVVMGCDRRRVFAANGSAIVVARLPSEGEDVDPRRWRRWFRSFGKSKGD
jgi:hypothetical protein